TVATNTAQIGTLRQLFNNGVQNGVEGLKMLDRRGIEELEPNVEAEMALYSPSSGIVDQDGLIEHFNSRAIGNNAVVSTDTRVTGIKKADFGYELSGTSVGQPFKIGCRTLINCAGLYADRVAGLVGLNVDECGYRISFYKGDYYRVLGDPLVQGLVYPVPHGAGLGIHLTPD
ncbi:FAD dependent oxidoreductase, partial [mine drainage metagenome]